MGGSWGLRPNVDKDSHFLKGTPHMPLTDWKVDQNYHHWFISVFLPSWPLFPSASSSPSPISFLLCIQLKYYELEVCIYQITSSDKRLLCSEHFLVGRIFRRHPGFFVSFCLLLHKVYKKSGNNLSKINELWFWNPVLWPPGAVTFLHLVYLPPSVSHVTLLHVCLTPETTHQKGCSHPDFPPLLAQDPWCRGHASSPMPPPVACTFLTAPGVHWISTKLLELSLAAL